MAIQKKKEPIQSRSEVVNQPSPSQVQDNLVVEDTSPNTPSNINNLIKSSHTMSEIESVPEINRLFLETTSKVIKSSVL